jgi:short-subunit dehydrogenase
MCRHFLPGMRARRSGGIINLASLGGYAPGPYEAVYYASKAYILSLSEALAAEACDDGVRVTAVAPGPVATAFHARMGSQADYYYRLLPQVQPANVAWWAHMGFRLGMRVAVPGVFNNIMALSMRIVPHRIVVPVIGWLLRPRNREAGDPRRNGPG